MKNTTTVKGHRRTYYIKDGKGGYKSIKKWIKRHPREISSKTKKAKPKTMFHEPKYKKYSEMIEMDDPESAKASIRKLKEEFNNAKTYDKKLVIKRAIQEAENRADAILKKKNLSSKERAEFKKIKQIYGNVADTLSTIPHVTDAQDYYGAELASFKGDKATTSQIGKGSYPHLRALEEKGFVEKIKGEGKKEYIWKLTQKGKKYFD